MSTHFTVGVAEDTRISSKVLKPPGGGSSLMFGEDPVETTPRRVKNYQASNLPLGDETERKNGSDSADGASTPSQSSASNGSPANSEPTTPRSGTPLNGPVYNHIPTPIRPHGRRVQGNPVTGEGYDGDEKKEDTPRKQRVPPGGYSSKLW